MKTMTSLVLALCLCQAQSIVLRAVQGVADGEGYKEMMMLANHKKANEFDEGDATEAELDDQAFQTFEPSKQLIAEWKDSGVHFARLEQSLPEMCKDEVMGRKMQKKECADPWIETKKCENAYEIPGYRLGDEFYQHLSTRNTAGLAQFYFPKSVGDLYWRKRHGKSDYNAMNEVVDDPEYKDFERPDEKTLVIHVRGYDILTKSMVKEVNKGGYQKGESYYQKVAEDAFNLGFTSATIVTGDHYVTQRAALAGKNATGNPTKFQIAADEAMRGTDEKLAMIKKTFEEKGFTTIKVRRNMNADCDFIYMSNAKYFAKGAGQFTQTIAEMVTMKGGEVW